MWNRLTCLLLRDSVPSALFVCVALVLIWLARTWLTNGLVFSAAVSTPNGLLWRVSRVGGGMRCSIRLNSVDTLPCGLLSALLV